jgi:hypothetical protein
MGLFCVLHDEAEFTEGSEVYGFLTDEFGSRKNDFMTAQPVNGSLPITFTS